MKRCQSVPLFQQQNGFGMADIPEDGHNGDSQMVVVSPTNQHPLAESDAPSGFNVNAVMQRVEAILGTSKLDDCDLNQITSEQFSKLNIIMQEANLVEQPATLVWKKLSYLREARRIFQGISGFIKPGMMICCLGPSSSGVSSFLRTLANRQQGGTVHGEIILNGLMKITCIIRTLNYC